MPRRAKTILAGLGNPGAQYIDTPHNIGHRFIDIVNNKYGIYQSQKSDYIICDINIDNKIYSTIKPLTFMNLSGIALRQYKDYNVFVFCDDCNTKIGNVKYSFSPYSGAHNGLKSIAQNINDFHIILLGVGNNRSYKMSDYVLQRMSNESIQIIEKSLLKLCDNLYQLLDQPEKYIQTFNKNIQT